MSGDITMTETTEKPGLTGEYLSLHDSIETNQTPDIEPDDPGVPSSELLKPIFQMVGGLLKPVLEAPEIDALSESYGLLLDKYFPDSSKLMGVELNCLLITAAVAVPRLQFYSINKGVNETDDKVPPGQTSDFETGAE